MNKYAIYNQDTMQSYGPFIASCRGNYMSTKKLNITRFELPFYSKISIVDMNGSVLLVDCYINKIEVKKEGRFYRTYVTIIGGES